MANEDDKVTLLAQQLIAGGKKEQQQFEIDYTDGAGNNYKGYFTVHRPTIGEKIRIGVLDARLRQELNVDIFTGNMAFMAATLLVVVDSSPDWWKPAQIYDFELLEIVYRQYTDWVNKFFRKNDPVNGGDKKSSDISDNLVADADGGSGGNK